MNRILITGANGFIGRYCLKLLVEKGYEIHAIDNMFDDGLYHENITWYKLDLNNHDEITKLLMKIRPNILLHMAWYISNTGYNDRIHYSWINLSMELIHAFKQSGGKRVVVIGSCAEYDWNYSFLTENITPLNSSTAYGAAKHALQIIAKQYCQHNSLSFSWARVFFVYGPGEKSNRLVPYVISSILNNNNVETTNGDKLRDYVYVKDVAIAIVNILESNTHGPVNICSGKPVRIKEIVDYIAEKLNGKHLIEYGVMNSNMNEPFSIIGNNSRLINEVGWKQSTTLEEGLDACIESNKKFK